MPENKLLLQQVTAPNAVQEAWQELQTGSEGVAKTSLLPFALKVLSGGLQVAFCGSRWPFL